MPKFKYDYDDVVFVPNHGTGTVIDVRYDVNPNQKVKIYYKVEFRGNHERYWIEEKYCKNELDS